MQNNRRDFLKLTGIAGLALGFSGFKSYQADIAKGNEIKFLSPVDGDLLNETDGTVTHGSLNTIIKISAPSGSRIAVNGVKAKYLDGIYQAEIRLNNYENILELTEGKKGHKENIKIFWLKNSIKRYRFSFNANILFMRDLTVNAEKYKSMFENSYLALMKEAHDTYGTKIHLNVFYQTEGFNLSQMTDKFKNEWKANAAWLELSFSALADTPDKPYIKAGYDQVKKECALVNDQIRRFAGEEVLSSETTLHWGEATVEGCRALRDAGYTILAGYFNVDDNKSSVSYYLNVEQRRNIKKRFMWRDNQEGISFGRLALVVNTVKQDQIRPYLDEVKKNYNPRHIDLMIHEHYFQPDYFDFQPDYKEKVMTAIKWAVDNGYQPGFIRDSVSE